MDGKVSTVLMQGKHNKPPLHFHLTDSTPLHVHVDKPHKPPNNLRSLSKDKNARIYNVINRQKQQHQQIQQQKETKNNLQSNKNNSEQYNAMESRMNLLNEKEKSLTLYEQKLKEVELKNNQLLTNIESVCSVLEAKNKLKDPSRMREWSLFLKQFSSKIEHYNALLNNFRQDRSATASDAQLEELIQTNNVMCGDLTSLQDLIVLVEAELNRLIDMQSNKGEVCETKNPKHVERLQSEIENFKKALDEKDNLNSQLRSDLQKTRDEGLMSTSTMESLRNVKAHLQRQLGYKDSELHRANARINHLEMTQEDNDRYTPRYRGRGGGGDDDRVNLKKAARLYKTKSQESERMLDEVREELGCKEAEVNALRKQVAVVTRESKNLQAELDRVKSSLASNSHNVEATNTSNSKNFYPDEIQNLNTSLNQLKVKLDGNESESNNLKTRVKEYEEVVLEYKSQNKKLNEDIGTYVKKIEGLQEDLSKNKAANNQELEKISRRFDELRENSFNNNECKDFLDKIQQLERKLLNVEEEKKELLKLNERKEATLDHKNSKLDEKMKEVLMVQGEVERVKAELVKAKEAGGDKLLALERSNQLQKMEFEAQVEALKQELNKIKRDKDENDRNNTQRLIELRERLEQCNSTNRTLQNYIHFLKTSYSAAFNEPIPTLANHHHYSNIHSLGTFSHLT